MLRAAGKFALIVGLSLAAAAVHAQWRGLRWTSEMTAAEYRARLERARVIKSERTIGLDEFKRLVASGAAVIDARDAASFEESHLDAEALGGLVTLHVVPETAAAQVDRLQSLLSFTDTILLYCNSVECDLSEELYIELENLGYLQGDFPRVRIYRDGWVGIEQAGLPTRSGPDDWEPAAMPVDDPGMPDDGAENPPDPADEEP